MIFWIFNIISVESINKYLGPENPIVGQSIEDVVDTNWAADGSVETENKEKSLILSPDTVTEKETMMVENINASPEHGLMKKRFWIIGKNLQ